MKQFCTIVMITFAFFSCGRKEQKVQTLAKSSDSNNQLQNLVNLKDSSCTESKCPSVTFKVEEASDESSKSIKIGEKAKWQFSLSTKAVEGRLLLFSKQIPVWSDRTDKDSSDSITISGTANQAVSDGKIILVVRDLMKCKNNTKKDDLKDCLQEDFQLDFDKEQSFDYTVSK